MRVKLKLVNHGCRNNPYWWIIAQPQKKKLNGRYLEHLGIWAPLKRATVPRQVSLNMHRVRYWLSVGATPTRTVHKLLNKYEFWPKLATPFGPKHAYEKPERAYHMTPHLHTMRYKGCGGKVAFYYRQKLQEQMNLVERKRRLTTEAQAVSQTRSESILEHETEDVISEEADIYTRKQNFELLAKKFAKHQQDKGLLLRGNDLRSNVWLKKMNKLARDDLGLDLAGYRDYVNNLQEFSHVNNDLSLLAYEGFVKGPGKRPDMLLQTRVAQQAAEFDDFTKGQARVEKHGASIKLSIAKLLRQHASYINDRDRAALSDLEKNFGEYTSMDLNILDLVRRLEQKQLSQDRSSQQQLDMLKELQETSMATLESANVSLKQLEEIKMLLAINKDIFRDETNKHPKYYLSPNLHDNYVDFTQLPPTDKLPKAAKQLLYRPNRMKQLREAYERLSEETISNFHRDDMEASKHVGGQKRHMHWEARFPRKTQEEHEWVKRIAECQRNYVPPTGQANVDAAKQEDLLVNKTIDKDIIQLYVERHRESKQMKFSAKFDEIMAEINEELGQKMDQFQAQVSKEMGGLLWDEKLTKSQRSEMQTRLSALKKEEEDRLFAAKSEAYLQLEMQEQEAKDSVDMVDTDEVENWFVRGSDLKVRKRSRRNNSNDELAARHSEDGLPDVAKEQAFDVFDGDAVWNTTDSDGKSKSDSSGSEWLIPREDINEFMANMWRRHHIDEARLYSYEYDIRTIKRVFKEEMRVNAEGYGTSSNDTVIESKASRLRDLVSVGQFDQARRFVSRQPLWIQRHLLFPSQSKGRADQVEKNSAKETLLDLYKAFEKLASEQERAANADSGTEDWSPFVLPENELDRLSTQLRNESLNYQKSKEAKNVEDKLLDELRLKLDKSSRQETEERIQRIRHVNNLVMGAKDRRAQAKARYEIMFGEPMPILSAESDESQLTKQQIAKISHVEQDLALAEQFFGKNEATAKLAGKSGTAAREERTFLQNEPGFASAADIHDMKRYLGDSSFVAASSSGSEGEPSIEPQQIIDFFDEFQEKYPLRETLAKAFEEQGMNLEDCLAGEGEEGVSLKKLIDEIDDKDFIAGFQRLEAKMASEDQEENSNSKSEKGDEEADQDEWFDRKGNMTEEKEEELQAVLMKELREQLRHEYKLYQANPDVKDKVDIDEDRFEELLDMVENKTFQTEEDADREIEEGYQKMLDTRSRPSRRPKDPSSDPSREFFEGEQAPVESLFDDHWTLTPEDEQRWLKDKSDRVGRYPEGFRHYENFASYLIGNPDATIYEYAELLNSEVSFDTFVKVMRQAALERSRDPEWRHENIEPDWLDQELRQTREDKKEELIQEREHAQATGQPIPTTSDSEMEETLEDLVMTQDEKIAQYVLSKDFSDAARKEFFMKQQEFLLSRKHYCLIDVLDDTINMLEFGRNMYDMPTHNSYVPVRHTIMPKPTLVDSAQELELPYRFNDAPSGARERVRIDLTKQLDSLKPYKTSPAPGTALRHHKEYQAKWTKYRRLSHVKRHFSTLVRPGSGFAL